MRPWQCTAARNQVASFSAAPVVKLTAARGALTEEQQKIHAAALKGAIEGVKPVMKEMDSNKDGRADPAEIKAYFLKVGTPSSPPAPPSGALLFTSLCGIDRNSIPRNLSRRKKSSRRRWRGR